MDGRLAYSSSEGGDARPVVAVVGLGYVGLPVALAFGCVTRTIGIDIDADKIRRYLGKVDPVDEVPREAFDAARFLEFTTDAAELARAEVVIVAIPTPVDADKRPDLRPLTRAAEVVARYLSPGVTVVLESTVYPGATEEHLVPLLERGSGLEWRKDFWVGYSPERINPGDDAHRFGEVIKVVAGDTSETTHRLAALYRQVVPAGVHEAPSIRVAEAAKVIENVQRDLNIALMNELSMVCHRLGLDTLDVLEAAGTKWNFLPFRPGLVGGHCVGVDPYYLTYQAERVGHEAAVILAGRRINDAMASYVAEATLEEIARFRGSLLGARVVVLGLTFKENCADLRNSQAATVVGLLQARGVEVFVHDPRAAADAARREYGLRLLEWEELPRDADALVLAVPHDAYLRMALAELLGPLGSRGVVIDVKSRLARDEVARAGYALWRL